MERHREVCEDVRHGPWYGFHHDVETLNKLSRPLQPKHGADSSSSEKFSKTSCINNVLVLVLGRGDS